MRTVSLNVVVGVDHKERLRLIGDRVGGTMSEALRQVITLGLPLVEQIYGITEDEIERSLLRAVPREEVDELGAERDDEEWPPRDAGRL